MTRPVSIIAKLSAGAMVLGLAAPLPLVLPSAPAKADTQNGCVSMGPVPGGTIWQVVNNCGHRVIGSFCYPGDRYFACNSPGGFGPIRPGGSEGVSAPGAGASEWRVAYCNYDDWVDSTCKIGEPG